MTTIERDTDDADLPDDRATTARPTFGPTYENPQPPSWRDLAALAYRFRVGIAAVACFLALLIVMVNSGLRNSDDVTANETATETTATTSTSTSQAGPSGPDQQSLPNTKSGDPIGKTGSAQIIPASSTPDAALGDEEPGEIAGVPSTTARSAADESLPTSNKANKTTKVPTTSQRTTKKPSTTKAVEKTTAPTTSLTTKPSSTAPAKVTTRPVTTKATTTTAAPTTTRPTTAATITVPPVATPSCVPEDNYERIRCVVRGALPLPRTIPIVIDGAPTQTPVCTSLISDPDGDGWGWERNATCVVIIRLP